MHPRGGGGIHGRKLTLLSHFPHKVTSSPQIQILSEKACPRALLGRYLQGRLREMTLAIGSQRVWPTANGCLCHEVRQVANPMPACNQDVAVKGMGL